MAFSGLKKSGFDFDGKVVFDEDNVNVGNSFNPSIGRFTAPHTAVYYFTISGVSGASKGYTTITIYKNGEKVLSINDGNNESSHNSMGYSWFESMNSGDTLELFVTSNNMYAIAENVFTFNGFSVVSRLILSSYQRYQPTFFQINPNNPNCGSARVAFSGIRNQGGKLSSAFITFDSAPINTGGVLNTETGIFTSSQAGNYAFSLAAFSSNKYVYIQVYKNGIFEFHVYDGNNKGNGNNLAYYWMDTLQDGDTIKLNKACQLYSHRV